MRIFAVLTGDIVNSSALQPAALDNALAAIQGASHELARWSSQDAPVLFARRGGDSWQVALPTPIHALRAALYVQATVKALDTPAATRIAIAVGEGAVPSNGDLNAAHGTAFTASGRALMSLRGPSTMIFDGGGDRHAATVLADHIAQGWTQAQARAVALVLSPKPPTQAAIAQILGVSRQAVNQSLQAAAMPSILAALKALEADGSDK